MPIQINLKIILMLLVVLGGVALISFKLGWETKEMMGTTDSNAARSERESKGKAVRNDGDQAAAWKTYTNYQYGFSLKYPESSMPEFYAEGTAFETDSDFPGVRIISFYRTTTDARYLESGTKTFPAFRVTLLPVELEEKYVSACEKKSDDGPLLMPCPPLKVDARSDTYVMYLDNFNQDQPADSLSDNEVGRIRSTLKAF